MSIRRKNTVSRKDEIIEKLKQNGCRITRQRKILIDISWKMIVQAAKRYFIRRHRRTERSALRRSTG